MVNFNSAATIFTVVSMAQLAGPFKAANKMMLEQYLLVCSFQLCGIPR